MISAMELDIATKLFLSALLGGLVGLEREHGHKPAGLRTNMLICIGATMFGLVGTYYFTQTDDISRLWQNILTGVGFLGAGAVFKDERNVRGLTTAATIWAVAALGLAVAAGLYFLAITSEVIILIALFALRRFEHHRAFSADAEPQGSMDSQR